MSDNSFTHLPVHEKVAFVSSLLFIFASTLSSLSFVLRLKDGGQSISDHTRAYNGGANAPSNNRASSYFTS
jgi:hypothetical protein